MAADDPVVCRERSPGAVLSYPVAIRVLLGRNSLRNSAVFLSNDLGTVSSNGGKNATGS
jgi:hypothetical protein